MLKLENIDKLIGITILYWQCVNVSKVHGLNSYLITFKHTRNTNITVEFILDRDDSDSKGMYKVNCISYESTGFSNETIGNFNIHVSRDELQTPLEFVKVLTKPLMVFERDIEIHWKRNVFSTASLSTFGGNASSGPINPFIGSSSPTTPKIAPDWYVDDPKLKPPTMWETFKEMVKWDKWINIVFPMRTIIKDITPTKKLKAKKAAY
jgi:hypothetical protein